MSIQTIESQLQRSFGSSEAIVASDTSSSDKVRMTKFQYLSPDQQQNSINLCGPNDRSSLECAAAHLKASGCNRHFRSISTVDLKQQQQDKHQQQHKCLHRHLLVGSNMSSKAALGQQGGKVPWLMVSASERASSKSASRLNIASDHLLGNNAPEPFQIVWRKLAYEVREDPFECSTRYLRKQVQFWRSKSKTATSTTGPNLHKSVAGLETIGSKAAANLSDYNANNLSVPNGSNPNQISPTTTTTTTTPTSTLEQAADNKRLIFENLNGYARSGEITAILGPSGAGKTSLLNAICGRTSNYRGTIQLIGASHKRHLQLSIIPQKDYLMENLSVRESLLYSSRILNVEKGFNHETNIMRVVRMLNLVNCLNVLGKNLSGGENKRVSIAQELLRQPDILVLDEPTSGLDSLNCKNLIKSLADLIDASRRGSINPIAIIMTIHQPDVDTYLMFDHVYCIARKGRVIFDGHPSETMDVLRSRAAAISGGGSESQNAPPLVAIRRDERVASTTTTTSETTTNAAETAAANNETRNGSVHSLTGLSNSAMVGMNPANLLIEIASESMYGDELINRLAAYQRKQFELYAATTLSLAPSRQESVVSLSSGLSQPQQQQQQQQQMDQNQPLKERKQAADANTTSSRPSLLDKDSYESSSSDGGGVCGGMKQIATSLAPPDSANQLIRDKRLSSKNRHKGLFWYHTCILTRRAFLAAFRDPLMTLVAFGFHLMIPFVMYVVYSAKIGKVTGCPLLVREMSILSLASNDTYGKLEQLQEDFMTTMEGAAMLFLSMYSFSMCSLAVAALAFPLNMHILLKELRNGWYRLPTFVLAKTLASVPFEVVFPAISLIMIYSILGLPSSYLEWRMVAIASVMALISMVSHTQGLVAGALFMDDVQTAVFLSIASTLPQVMLSGFTARIRQMPTILQYLSWLSQYRYASDLNSIIRYGFGMCKCDANTDKYLRETKPSFADVPNQMKSFLLFYLNDTTPSSTTDADLSSASASASAPANGTTDAMGFDSFEPSANSVAGISYDFAPDAERKINILKSLEASNGDLFDRMAELVSRSFSYGRNITDCDSVRSQGLALGFNPPDSAVPYMFGMLVLLVFIWKAVLYFVVRCKIASRV